MIKEVRLSRKIKRFLRRLGCPRWLHHFGPKTYQLWQHIFALIAGAIFRLSLRRITKLLREFDVKVPTYSALCKSRKRIPSALWQKVMELTAGDSHVCVAIDSTGISRANPSHHYIKRIDRKKPVKSYVKQSSIFDVRNKVFVALRVRAKPRHDIQDAKYLLDRIKTKNLLGDTAYDANWLHQLCWKRGIQTQIKPRKNVRRGFYRKKQMKRYSEDKYHQRSLIESGQGGYKRKYGGFTLAKYIRAIKSEAYCKAIAYNMRLSN
jgi:transposase